MFPLYTCMNTCVPRFISSGFFGISNLIQRNPSARGGFLSTMFPNQEPGGRGPLKNHPQNWSILVVGFQGESSSSGFLIWKPPNKETPPGGGFLSIKVSCLDPWAHIQVPHVQCVCVCAYTYIHPHVLQPPSKIDKIKTTPLSSFYQKELPTLATSALHNIRKLRV